MSTLPLLVEIGTEELPVRALPGLAASLLEGMVEALARRGIDVDRGDARALYTPRRLAVLLPAVATAQPEQRSEVMGPYLNIALDADGAPTRALQGFAQKAGVDWSRLERTTDAKGERFVHRAVAPGAATTTLLPEVLQEAVAGMPIPKPMRWGAHDHAFARPVHWLVLLFGDDVVEAELFGARADRMSRGHRFLHDKTVWIARPDEYIEALRGARVLVDPAERRARIVEAVEAAAHATGGRPRIDEDNLAQVNCLVEWPSAVACSFDPAFLAVPQEALVATMEANQKFFPVLAAAGGLTEHFIGVANIAPEDDREIRKGYERVITPRFADAKFFFDEDLKQGLASMNDGLSTVTYQQKLPFGSVADKVDRLVVLSVAIASWLGEDVALARRAAHLSKADLQSRMVGEFPELQGIAGKYLATSAGEAAEVAAAIEEAYLPRIAGEAIAPSAIGRIVALADRADTIAAAFQVGLKPTGNKDPFSLRRNGLGLARTLIEGGLDVDLDKLVSLALALLPSQTQIHEPYADDALIALVTRMIDQPDFGANDLAREIRDFIVDRLRSYYAEQGVPAQHFEAVSALRPNSLTDFDQRLRAIGEFARLPEAEALAAANKRIRNILRKADDAPVDTVDASLLREPAERALAEAVEAAYADSGRALADGDYAGVLARLARLRPQVDAFFDAVMVNADDPALRNNRLALLRRLADRLGSVAAIEHLSS